MFLVALSTRMGQRRCQMPTTANKAQCPGVGKLPLSSSLLGSGSAMAFTSTQSTKDSGSVDQLPACSLWGKEHSSEHRPGEPPSAMCSLCASVSPNTEENATQPASLFSWGVGKISEIDE